MGKIEIVGWQKDGQDYNGKELAEVFFILLDNQLRAVGKGDLLKMIKMTLPERSEAGSRQDYVATSEAADGHNL